MKYALKKPFSATDAGVHFQWAALGRGFHESPDLLVIKRRRAYHQDNE